MKRISLLFALLILAVFPGFAGEVSQERAASVATSFFASAPTKSQETSVQLVATFPEILTKAPDRAPALYVFERGAGGYVVVSGDDVSLPVVGYSLSGQFPKGTDLPDNMRSLLEWYVSIIEYARAQGWKAAAPVRSAWEDIGAAPGSSDRVVLETARWGQGAPYNDLCPSENGQKCPTGCVATAMAIIMRYHQYPEKGSGTLPGYDYGWDSEQDTYLYHLDGFDLGHVYRWDLMPMNYRSGFYSQEEGAQVARLMYDLGVMSRMDYAPGGSGAPGTSPLLLAEYFGYDKQMRFLDRAQFSDTRWEQLIRDEIDAGRPVFHCGFYESGGHAFVIDGYEGRYFSINYGWSGGSAFYLLTPPVDGNAERLTQFTEWQDMVTHIEPDRGGEAYVSFTVPNVYRPFPWDFLSKSFTIGQTYLWISSSTGSGSAEMCYALFDRDEVFKSTVSDPFTVSSDNASVPQASCRITVPIEDGDRVLLARRDASGWLALPHTRNGFLQFDLSRTLPEMVTPGHALVSPETVADQGPCLYMMAYKDIWWEVWSEEGDEVIATSRDSWLEKEIAGGRMFFDVYDGYDSGRDTFTYRFFLPSGHYRVTFRNFDEEMVFKVTL